MNTPVLPLAPLGAALARHLGRTALAVAGTAFVATAASAAVITVNGPINVPNNFDGLYINLVTGATGTSGAGTTGWDINPYNSGTSLSIFWNSGSTPGAGGVGTAPAGAYSVLTEGTTISAASSFSNGTASANTLGFQPPGTRYLGFRFFNESTSSINYGYMSLTSAGSNGFPLTINGWSYENTGGSITIPAIPEPGTGLMLAAGALALGAMRKRFARRDAT